MKSISLLNRKFTWLHLVAWIMLPLFLFSSVPPLAVLAATTDKVKHSAKRVQEHKPAKRDPNKKNKPNLALKKHAIKLSASPTDNELVSCRVFGEPLAPMSVPAVPGENASMAKALLAFCAKNDPENVSDLTAFLSQFPKSRWHAALEMDLGGVRYNCGYISQALEFWQACWNEAKDEKGLAQKAVADKAFGELAIAKARVGQIDKLDKLFAEAGNRPFKGSVAERIANAKFGLARMKNKNKNQNSFKCGPYAINNLLNNGQKYKGISQVIRDVKTTSQGTNLAQINDLADKVGLHYQMAKRSAGAKFLFPSVYHLKVGHFAAITGTRGGKYRIKDPTFDDKAYMSVSAKALDSESDGYFLVPAGPLPTGWTAVNREEGAKVWGRGDAIGIGANPKGCDGITCQECHLPKDCYGNGDFHNGMADCNAYQCQATLNIFDTPVSYGYSLGKMSFLANYDNQTANQPESFTFTTFGQDWNFNWLSYLTVDESSNITVRVRGGASECYNYLGGDSPYAPDLFSQAQMSVLEGPVYERQLVDGTVEVFSLYDSAVDSGAYFLTQVIDPRGNTIDINYDDDFRITTIEDALGQSTTIAYASTDIDNPGYYRIASITDPYGRAASFSYDATNTCLLQITDVMGMQSQFRYVSGTSFINLMTTPYGSTSFYAYDPSGVGSAVGLRTTYPDGTASVIETWIDAKNSYYWNREQTGLYPNDPGNQVYTHCLVSSWLMPSLTEGENLLIPVPASVKQPLEYEVAYAYPDQPGGDDLTGSINKPSSVSRYTIAGTQTYQYTYNSIGKMTQSIDPIGRTFSYSYADNEIDLLEKRETQGDDNYLMGHWEYNDQHEPTIYIDGSSQETQFSYNAVGELTSRVDADSNTWTLSYDDDYYLETIQGPLAGDYDVTTVTFDSAGRLASKTDSLGYELDFYYDDMDRPVQTSFPDGTTDLTTWYRLDPVVKQDRLGRITQDTFDCMRQLASDVDPLGRVTDYTWCSCGSISTLTDPNGNVTTWNHDLEGRLTQKVYADSSQVNYVYDGYGGWLYSVTDALSQIKYFSYNLDHTVSEISYSDSVVSTSNCSFTYDAYFNRLLTAENGWGTITYAFNPYVTEAYGTPITGGGRLSTISNNVISNSQISFGYDALGRTTNRSVNTGTNSDTWTFDAINRVTAESNNLGSFTFNYLNPTYGTNQLSSIDYPNSQTTNFSWYTSASPTQFELLEEISNLDPSSNNLTQYGYEYSAVGDITQWTQKVTTGSTNTISLGYDLSSQLTSASGSSPWSYSYEYDNAANCTSVTSSDVTTTATINNLNQITALSGGTTATLTFDSNGNMTSDGTNSYSYDAENRLVKITYPGSGNNSQISYDAFGGRVKIVETVSSSVTSTKQFVNSGSSVLEERDASSTITKQFFGLGQTLSGSNYYYTRDHLGSVRDMTDSSGTVQAHYEYGMYGEVTQTVGTLESDFQYAGYYFHAPSGLNLTLHRAYNPSLGRWINRDPIHDLTFKMRPRSPEPKDPGAMVMPLGSVAGASALPSLALLGHDPMIAAQLVTLIPGSPRRSKQWNDYAYVSNKPISLRDPSGLQECPPADDDDDDGIDIHLWIWCSTACFGHKNYVICFWDCIINGGPGGNSPNVNPGGPGCGCSH